MSTYLVRAISEDDCSYWYLISAKSETDAFVILKNCFISKEIVQYLVEDLDEVIRNQYDGLAELSTI